MCMSTYGRMNLHGRLPGLRVTKTLEPSDTLHRKPGTLTNLRYPAKERLTCLKKSSLCTQIYTSIYTGTYIYIYIHTCIYIYTYIYRIYSRFGQDQHEAFTREQDQNDVLSKQSWAWIQDGRVVASSGEALVGPWGHGETMRKTIGKP